MKNWGFLFNLKRLEAALSTVLLVFFLFAVAGCGSGSSYVSQVDGVAAKGLIRGGDVKIYKIDESGARGSLLATTVTNDDGEYSVTVYYSGPVLVEVTGGSYLDEATGEEVDREEADVLRAAVSVPDGVDLNVAVTDLTEVAVRIAEKKDGGLSEGNIAASNEDVSMLLGVDEETGKPVMDITKVNPVDINDAGAYELGSKNQKTYARMLAVISQADENDDEKESDAILDDLADYLGGSTPAGSVSMETTLTQAAADFFSEKNPNNKTGETDFTEIRKVVSQAKYSSPERVKAISVFMSKEDDDDDRLVDAVGDSEFGKVGTASFGYDTVGNLTGVTADIFRSEYSSDEEDKDTKVIAALTYNAGNLETVDVKMGEKTEDGGIADDHSSRFMLENKYDKGLLTQSTVKADTDGMDDMKAVLAIAFQDGNLYDIASCMSVRDDGDDRKLGSEDESKPLFTTSVDAAGLLKGVELNRDGGVVRAEITRLENGRIDRILLREIPFVSEESDAGSDFMKVERRERIIAGNWFRYDDAGNLKTVVWVDEISHDGLEEGAPFVEALFKAKDLDAAAFKTAVKGLKLDDVQYTTYKYREVKNGMVPERIAVKLVTRSWSSSGDTRECRSVRMYPYYASFKEFTEEGNAGRIELWHKPVSSAGYEYVSVDEGEAGAGEESPEKDALMGYAELTYEEGAMKSNVWLDALKEGVRHAYRNIRMLPFRGR